MSSMDLDLSLDDLIKQKKNNKNKKGFQQQQKSPKKQQQKNKNNLNFQTNAKIKKTTAVKPKNDIISRLSLANAKSFTTNNSKPTTNQADPSQIIITKAVSSFKNRLGPNSQKEVSVASTRTGKVSSILTSRLGSRQQQQPHIIPKQESPRIYERPAVEERSSISIRGRSSVATHSSGLSIKGESGPTLVLVSGLDRGTNSEDVKLVCEDFGNVLRCEVLRNRMGESFGEAEVEFSTKSAALDCIAKLDNVKADGQYLRVLLRDNKHATPRSYAASQISSIISTPSTSSGKMYSDQIPNRYGVGRR
ncbi:hypothetical protein G6F56_005373 [Rhizopus delemar]|nr:hypothetical protein G6F56_005373 [Rhizopus delemar]